MSWTLGELAEEFDGKLVGPADFEVRPVPADVEDPGGIAFCENSRYLSRATGVGAVLLPEHLSTAEKPYVQVADPREVFARMLKDLERPLPLAEGIHPTAVVDPEAYVDQSASVGAYAVVERGAVVNAGVRVYPFTYVGENCVVGAGSVLYPHVVLYQDVRLGEGCAVHPGAVVGTEGFGFARDGDGWRKVPQVGDVQVEDEVEIRALASVERANSGTTRICRGAKIGNLAHVGHNVRIGEQALMVPMSGIAGSSVLGDRAVLGGGAAVGDHVTVAEGAQLGARALATRDIREPGTYVGQPARPLRQQYRVEALLPRLQELFDRVRELEQALPARPGPAQEQPEEAR